MLQRACDKHGFEFPLYPTLAQKVYFGLEKCYFAIKDFNNAIQLNPNHSCTYYNCGTAYYHLEVCVEFYFLTLTQAANFS